MLPEDVRRAASQRFAQDKSDTGIAPENDIDLIDYTDFGDLTKMLHARSVELSTEFRCDITTLATRLEKMIPARNRVCHSRPLEEDDLPNFLDLAKDFLHDFKRLPWREGQTQYITTFRSLISMKLVSWDERASGATFENTCSVRILS
jgi:hypothetical protein